VLLLLVIVASSFCGKKLLAMETNLNILEKEEEQDVPEFITPH
jgi:hypothetical protein